LPLNNNHSLTWFSMQQRSSFTTRYPRCIRCYSKSVSIEYACLYHVSRESFCPNIWYLFPLPTIFQLYGDGQFYRWRKSEYQEKDTDLSQVTDKLDYILLYREYIAMSRVRTLDTRGCHA
jgi:hypothetical protein